MTWEQPSGGHPYLEPQLRALVGEVLSARCSAVKACDRPVVAYLVWQETSETSSALILEPSCARHRADVRRLISAVSGRIIQEVPRPEVASALADLRGRGFSLVLPPPHGATQLGEVYLSTSSTSSGAAMGRVELSTTSMRGRVPAHREYIARRAQRLLPPGTTIRQVFGAQCFFPWLISPLALLYLPFMRWRVVAVADNGIYVFSASFWLRWRPRRLLRRLPRNTRLGPVAGVWPRISLGPERVWVNWRFFGDIDDADYDLELALRGG